MISKKSFTTCKLRSFGHLCLAGTKTSAHAKVSYQEKMGCLMNRQCAILLLLVLFFAAYTKQVLALAVWIPGWQQASEMNSVRAGASVLQVNGVIYAIGGINGHDFLNTTEYSKINLDGSLAAWQRSAILNDARGFFDVVEHNGFIYAAGGGKGENGQIIDHPISI